MTTRHRTHTIPADTLVPAWQHAALTTGDYIELPVHYRTYIIEAYLDGIRIVTNDTLMMLVTWAPIDLDTPPPPIDVKPEWTVVAVDRDQRALALMKWLEKEVRRAAKDHLPPPEVELSISSAEDPAVPTLSPDLERQILLIQIENESLALPLLEADPFSWRALVTSFRPSPEVLLGINAHTLERLGKFKLPATEIIAGKDNRIFINDPSKPLFGAAQGLQTDHDAVMKLSQWRPSLLANEVADWLKTNDIETVADDIETKLDESPDEVDKPTE